MDVLRPHQGLAVVEVGRGQATAELADIVETAAIHPLLQASQHRDVVRSAARRSDEAVITTSAPASRYLTTSSAVATPLAQ